MKKLLLLVFLVSCYCASASHLRAGFITAERTSCASISYAITITVFTNTSSIVNFGGDGILYFGDGTSMVVPEVQTIHHPELGPEVGMAEFTIVHSYSALGSYTLSYVEPNRNGGVINMKDSFFTPFCTQTKIVISTDLPCVSSPEFNAPPFFKANFTTEMSLSMGAVSKDDLELGYALITPYQDVAKRVNEYKFPETLDINPLNGIVSWEMNFNGNSALGEFSFAVKVFQSKTINGNRIDAGYVIIDFQIIVDDLVGTYVSDDQELDQYNRILVTEDETKTIEVSYSNENFPNITVEAFSELQSHEDVFSFSTFEQNGMNTKVGVVTITPTAAIVRDNPYLITVRGGSETKQDINYLIYTKELPELVITSVEKDLATVQIFPNPTQDNLNVRINRPGVTEVFVYTPQGQCVRKQSFESETEVILSDLPPGIYVCEIRRNNFVIRKTKVIKH